MSVTGRFVLPFGRGISLHMPERFTLVDAKNRNASRTLSALALNGIEPATTSDEDPFSIRYFINSTDRGSLPRVLDALRKEGLVVKVDPAGDEELKYWSRRSAAHLKKITKVRIYGRYRIHGRLLPFYANAACELCLYTDNEGWHEHRLAPKAYESPTSNVEPMQYREPIDVVFTWVDGDDPNWVRRKNQALTNTDGPHAHAIDRARFDSRDDLRFAIRSVVNYMPWVRNIYVVTDGQSPSWLRETNRVTIVDHKDIFPEGSVLPTFNSHAIESVLHRIDGLSEIFLYMNDDFFIRRPLRVNTFVAANGITSVFLSQTHIPSGPVELRNKASEWGAMNASAALRSRFGQGITHLLRHAPYVISRSGMYAFEEDFPESFAQVRSTQFRSNQDIAPIAGYLYYAIWTRRAVPRDCSYGYVDLAGKSWKKQLSALETPARCAVFCINDAESQSSEASLQEQKRIVRDWLSRHYPSKLDCER